MEGPSAVEFDLAGEQESTPALNSGALDSSLSIGHCSGSSEGAVVETLAPLLLDEQQTASKPKAPSAVIDNPERQVESRLCTEPPSDPDNESPVPEAVEVESRLPLEPPNFEPPVEAIIVSGPLSDPLPTGTTSSDSLASTTMESGSPSDVLVVVKSIITPTRASLSQQGSADKQLTGMKPIVPLRKRGQSFRETKKMIATVDADGRRHLNQYTFMEQLGKGAYGIVFKVECNETKEVFAAKCVDKKALKRIRVGRFGNALQSVKKELNIWKRFKHRHIVVLREVIDTDDSDELYMISELVEGGPVLDDDIKCTPLNAELTKTFFTHLIEGIDFLHENKIIHRDIKPGNLLLKTVDDDEVILRIADFGVSHEMEHDNENMRQTAGTAIFMAPEMLTGDSFQGKPVDIWACGVTLYMFVYGHPPFIAQTMTVLYGKIQSDPIEFPTQVGDRVVEEELIHLMQHLLEKDPRQRFTSQQIRAHPWAWREFQVSAIKCVTHPDGRRTSFSGIPKSLAGVASLGKSMRSLFSRPSAVFPGGSNRSSLPTVMANLRAPQ
ncbi:Protein kinase domain [Phytophthora infestans]|uniref:Protein kinase domain n=1 Tax=Phytophthora infestans TaxID=4787 RepID=A0A833SGM6_PHYIN|nr:Protein kinase domain [Phytophthora infestans]KAF4145170.1 Protein kinase domain [Phytophthora infestans]